jgi:hypothetical protein
VLACGLVGPQFISCPREVAQTPTLVLSVILICKAIRPFILVIAIQTNSCHSLLIMAEKN